jgi:DNA repair protein RadC
MMKTALLSENRYTIVDSVQIITDGDRRYDTHKAFRDLPQEEKPREKLTKYGPAVLSTPELIAVILGVGTKKEDVLTMAKRLVKEYGENAIVNERDPKKIEIALGISQGKASQLIAAFELGRRFFKSAPRGATLRTARQVYEYAKDMSYLPKEHLRGIYLDAHYRVLRDETISIGSVSANMVHPREVFRPALEYNASAVILVHNHPSGVTTPSDADKEITKQLVAAGNLMGVHLLDHIIVGKNKFTSIPADYDL